MAEYGGAGLALAARTLAIDQMTSEVVTALRAGGVRPVLLKGASIASWLYTEDFRPYGDVDLLVAPASFRAAARILRQLGFGEPTRGRAAHAHTYRRLGGEGLPLPLCVDLHRSLPYLSVPPREVWRVLSADTETLRVGDVTIDVLGIPARFVHLAIHALQHAFETKNPYEDLRRALAVVTPVELAQAVAISRRLGAEDALAAGLELLPEGQQAASDLGLTTARRGILRFGGDSDVELAAFQVQRIVDARSAGERANLLYDMVFVSPAVLRQTSHLARRSPGGIAAAYAVRPFVLAGRMGPALLHRRRIVTHS